MWKELDKELDRPLYIALNSPEPLSNDDYLILGTKYISMCTIFFTCKYRLQLILRRLQSLRGRVANLTVVIIYVIIGSECENIRGNTIKKIRDILLYIKYAWTYVCNFCTLAHDFCVAHYLG